MSIAEFVGRLKGRSTAIQEKEGYRTINYTYSELALRIGKVGRLLERMKIGKGDRVIIIGRNGIDWVSLFLGAMAQGVIVVPLDIQSDNVFVKKIVKLTKPKVLFTSKKISGGVKTVGFDDLDMLLDGLKEKLPAKVSESDIAQILYTSGTTGDPKGVVLNHGNIMASLKGLRKVILLPRLRFISVLPLSHVLEQIAGLILPLSYKCNVLYPGTVRPGKITDIIQNKKVNAMTCVPAVLESLRREELGWQFFLIGVGGAPLDIELEKKWMGKLLVQGYGLTETSALVATNTLTARKRGTVGKVLPGVKVRLEDGEILVKGKNVFSGYYKDKDKTKAAFSNGWFRTGDLGEFKGRYLAIKGRKKDMIVTPTGENIYPQDIEEVLDSFPEIEESCVVDIEGHITAAVIVRENVSLSKVMEKANKKLLPKQKIRHIEMWRGEFPKTATGKIKRFTVKKQTGKHRKVKGDALSRILGELSRKQVNQNTKLGDLAIDSLQRVQLVTKIEEVYNVELAEQEITEKTRVKDIKEMISRRKKIQSFRFEHWLLNPITSVVRRIFQEVFFLPLTRIFVRVECEGKLRDLKGPVILMPNHQSSFDVPIIMRCLPFRIRRKMSCAASPPRMYGIPDRGLSNPLESLFLRLFFNTFPFGTEIGVDRSFEFTGEMLDRGYNVFMFPEGMRSRDERIGKLQRGTGLIAVEMKVPIVPVKIEGLSKILPFGKFWPKFGKVKVKFGKPIKFKGSYVDATKKIEDMVRRL